MGRIDLQLFALKLNTEESIVDYLKSVGQDSSYSNRKKMASQYGISNYAGTEEQNIKLLNLVKNASAANNTTSAKKGNTTDAKKVTEEPKKVASEIVDNKSGKSGKGGKSDAVQAAEAVIAEQTPTNAVAPVAATPASTAGGTTGGSITPEAAKNIADLISQGKVKLENIPEQFHDAILGYLGAGEKSTPTFTPTQAPTYTPQQYTTPTFTQSQAPTYTGQTTQANQATTLDQRLPADTLAALNSQFQVSQAYQQAMQYTNSLLQQLSGGKTTYSDQISQLINDYKNREKFSYNADSDPMFQQALSSAMRSGKTAMQDTMGQAAALTGGYGSSYATGVGQNAYNQYVQEAYDMLPEYYQLALDAYEREGQSMLNQLSIMDNADSKEYDRLYNAYNMNYNSAQNMYNQEYGAWKDSVNNAYNYAGLLNSDYWNKMDYDESIRQYDQNFGYQQYLDSLNQSNWQNEFNYQQYQDQIAQNQWQSEFDYKQYFDSLNQNNWQNEFNYQQYQDAINQGNIEWEQGFKESESNRDQGNIEWEQGFKQDESDRDQGNIEWEQNFTKDEANRDQSNIDWEHGYKESESERDQSNIDWEHGYKENESDRDQSNIDRDFNYNAGQDAIDNQFRQDEANRDQGNIDWEHGYKEEAFEYQKESDKQAQSNYEREMAIKESKAQAEETGEEYEYKTPTEKMFTTGLQAAVQGGEAAVVAYCDTIGEYDGFAIVDYVQKKLTFTKKKDTVNGLWGLDHNDVFVDGYGQTYTLDEIRETLGITKDQAKKLTSSKEGATVDLFAGN